MYAAIDTPHPKSHQYRPKEVGWDEEYFQIEGIILGRRDAAEIYRGMSEDERAEVTRLMVDEEYTDFPTAVYTVYEDAECEY